MALKQTATSALLALAAMGWALSPLASTWPGLAWLALCLAALLGLFNPPVLALHTRAAEAARRFESAAVAGEAPDSNTKTSDPAAPVRVSAPAPPLIGPENFTAKMGSGYQIGVFDMAAREFTQVALQHLPRKDQQSYPQLLCATQARSASSSRLRGLSW